MAVLNSVDKFYRNIIEVVLLGCRELFLDDGVDETVLTELKQMWERKVKQAKVFEFSNLKHTNSSFNIGSYGIISSARNISCPEILVPSIHLTGPRGDGLNPCTPTATIALPYGLYQQQISALNNAGISLQPSGNGQFLAVLRPDQQRLQSLTVPQNRQVSGKGHPIVVSTPSVAPVRPEVVNLNMVQPNRVSTSSVPPKAIPELNKQINLPSQGVVKNGPNGNIAVKVTENTYPQLPLHINNTNNNAGGSSVTNASNNLNGSNIPVGSNPNIAENANSNINTSNPNKDNTAPFNIKVIPNDSSTITTTNSINNVEGLTSFTNTSNTPNNNSVRSNDCIIGTNPPPVSTNTTANTFNTVENTHPPLRTYSTGANPSYNTQMYNNEAYYNQPLRTLPNNFGNQPDSNGYPLNPGLYDNRLYPTAQTGGSFGVPNQPESLDDYMDNLSDSNNGTSYSYVNPQPSPINADRNITTDFDSAVNTISNLIRGHSTSSDSYNNNNNTHSLSGPPSTTDYKRAPSDGEVVPGQTSRFSEEDMQTIQEILQLDGAGDDYEFKSAIKSTTLMQHETLRGFPPKRQPGEKNVTTGKINNPKIPKTKSENIYQNSSASRKTRNFNVRNYFLGKQSPFQRLKMRKILKKHSPRRDYVLNKTNYSPGDNLIVSMGTDAPGSGPNSTPNKDQEYDLKTEIPKCGSFSKTKKSQFFARSVSKSAPMVTLNRFEKWPNVTITKDKRSEIRFRSLSPDSNSSLNSVPPSPQQSIQFINDIPPTLNPRSSKAGIMVSKKTEEVETCREFGPFLHARVRHQFDGEDAGSSSSSDDNVNANDALSDDEDDDDDDGECEEANEEIEDVAIESEPLNSADDDSDIDICAMFESENIVVCQFEKISRNKNKWKFHLKDGIMNLYGRDLIFSKSVGEAEW